MEKPAYQKSWECYCAGQVAKQQCLHLPTWGTCTGVLQMVHFIKFFPLRQQSEGLMAECFIGESGCLL